MRIRDIIRAAGAGFPLVLVTLACDPAAAQFREIAPEGTPKATIDADLTPTQQPFVAPRDVTEPESRPGSETPPATPTPAVAPSGTPTPADALSGGTPPPAAAEDAKAKAKEAAKAKSQTEPAKDTTPAPADDVADKPVSETAPKIPEKLKTSDPYAAFVIPTESAPSAAPSPQDLVTPEPLIFNEITPGKSTVSDVETQWGAAAAVLFEDAQQRLVYRAPGFQQVDLTVAEDSQKITSLVIHLETPVVVDQLEKQLGLTNVRPVEVTDEEGTALGRGYPERGVLLSYAVDAPAHQVSHIGLEAVKGDLYRLRAELNQEQRYQAALADLEEATRLNPQDAKAYWLQAELLSVVGRHQDALDSAAIAMRIAPENPLYRLTSARLGASGGELTDALATTRAVLEDLDTPSIVRARAEYQLGNLLAFGMEPDYQESLNYHLKAIDSAVKHVRSTNKQVRHMAKDILVDAHLAIAQDIALGNFQRQQEVVSKWLARATELTEDFITQDDGDPTLRMEVYRTTLAAYSVLEGDFDASVAAEEAITEAQRLVAEADDQLYQFQVERELSETLYHAAKIEHQGGRLAAALRFADNAVVLLDASRDETQPALIDKVMAGQLYYFTGSLYALQEEDHGEAIKWYEKALPAFDDERLAELIDLSAFGDVLVSMGVSFWEAGEKEQAIELTEAGAELMQQGVQSGAIEMLALSVPYGNLATMHKQIGNPDQAQHFATMMAKVEKDGQPLRR